MLDLHREGVSYRLIGRNLGLSKNTMMQIIKRGSITAAAQKKGRPIYPLSDAAPELQLRTMVILGLVVKGRPWAYLQPEVPGLSVLVRNMAKEPIFIKSFKCKPVSLFVGRSHETRDIAEAQTGVPLNTVIAAESKHSFSLLTKKEWDELVPDRKVVITLRWSLTRSRWLPQFPTRIRKTVGFVKAVMRFTRKPDDILSDR